MENNALKMKLSSLEAEVAVWSSGFGGCGGDYGDYENGVILEVYCSWTVISNTC